MSANRIQTNVVTTHAGRRRTALGAAISSCLAMAAMAPAYAQESNVEEVVVTGYRASLADALERKRESTQMIESITAEDIGKFPDQNVAESLQRLPGVQINRANGHGTSVLIYGLRQNLITLNGDLFLTGREFYVSGEASGGGAGSNSQSSSLEGIPSEQIGGIDVIKSPTASNTEGGLGGIIDLKTRSPLAQADGLNLSGSARATEADDAEGGLTPVITLVAGYKFNDNLGITLGLSYDDEKTHIKEYQAQNRSQWLITNSAQVGSYVGSPTAATLSTIGQYYIIPQFAYFSDILEERKTTGASLGIEWRWSDAMHGSFNWFHSRGEDENITYSNKTWFNGQGASPGTLIPAIDPSRPYSIDGNGVVQSAAFMANGAETATLFQSMDTRANNFQLATYFDNGGALSWEGHLAYAKATSDLQAAQADIEHGAYGAFNQTGFIRPTAPGCNNGGSNCTNGNHGYTFNWTNGGTSGLPTVSYPNMFGVTDVLSNPAYVTFKSNWAWANLTDQKNLALRFDAKFDPSFADNIVLKGGLRYSTRDVDQTFGRYLINGAGNLGVGGVGAGTAAGNCCISTGQSGTYLYYSDPGYATIPWSTAATNPGLVRNYNSFASGLIAAKDPYVGGMTNPATYLNTVWNQAGVPNNTSAFFEDTLSSFEVEEKTTAAYFKLETGSPSDHYHIDAGVRVVLTELTVDNAQQAPVPTWYGTASWNGVNRNNIPSVASRDYVDVLPSLNITLDLSDTQKFRIGASRVVAPQDLFDLGLGKSYNFTRGTDGPGGQARFKFANGSSGNPELDPFRASQFNVSYENYFSEDAILVAGVFYKAVDNFVETQNIPTLVNDDFGGTVGNVNQPVNAGKGKIYGFELGAQYVFDFGLGLTGNYTRSNSESDQETYFVKNAPIPGVSKDSFNLTAFYEHAGFSARAAYSWRSEAVNDSLVGATFSFPDQNDVQRVYGIYSADYGQLDVQVGYDFNERLGILASINNVLGEEQHTYLQYKNQPFTYNDAGARYFIGVKAKL